ncbi:MAG: hypothetical protein GY851_32965 [bacterium]|nr:hypothetical protein [bacterium]
MRRLNQYLLVNSSQPENAYGPFAAEILRTEGLMGFTQVNLAREPLPDLRSGDLIVVSRCFMRRAQLETLLDAVKSGASAVFVQPQQLLAEMVGFSPACRVVHPGFVRIGEGLPLQTHLPIPCYHMPDDADGWETIADAVDEAWRPAGHPAVARGQIGQGTLALFFYDLAEAIARIRFGNPDLSSYVTNGSWAWAHAFDLFEGHIDERVAHLPQADLHAQLLASTIVRMAPYPMARLWYYEDADYGTVGIVQSDGDMSTREQFQELSAALETCGGTGTFYLMKETNLTEADVEDMRARGHTFGPHVAPVQRDEELYFAVPEGLAEETALFAERFGAVSPTLQCHFAPWPSYMAMVPAHVANGYRLLFAYLPAPDPFWAKFVCGSGRPARFFDRDGTLHDCWQQPLLTMDDTSVIELLRDNTATAQARFDAAFDAAREEHHTSLAILSHPVSFATYSSPVQKHCFARFHDAGLPIYNADEWLEFTDRRAGIDVRQMLNDSGGSVVEVSGIQGSIPVMIPATSGDIRVVVNGKSVEPRRLKRLGAESHVVQLDSAEHGHEARIEIAHLRGDSEEEGSQ